jgi:ABC-type Na+ efflux pump permease subunit
MFSLYLFYTQMFMKRKYFILSVILLVVLCGAGVFTFLPAKAQEGGSGIKNSIIVGGVRNTVASSNINLPSIK